MKMDIKGTTRVCGLIGHPVHHTLSPAIHNTLSELTDTDMVYAAFEVQEDDVEAAIKGALALDIQGLNDFYKYVNSIATGGIERFDIWEMLIEGKRILLSE